MFPFAESDPIAEAIASIAEHPLVQTAISLIALGWIALYLISAIGVYRDLLERSGSRRIAAIAGGAILLSTPVAFPVTLLLIRALRPSDASRDRHATDLEARVMAAEAAAIVDCPTCEQPLPAEWMACPNDGALVRARCAACKGLIALRARACPLCGAGAIEAG